jgi:hypothetical protein
VCISIYGVLVGVDMIWQAKRNRVMVYLEELSRFVLPKQRRFERIALIECSLRLATLAVYFMGLNCVIEHHIVN